MARSSPSHADIVTPRGLTSGTVFNPIHPRTEANISCLRNRGGAGCIHASMTRGRIECAMALHRALAAAAYRLLKFRRRTRAVSEMEK